MDSDPDRIEQWWPELSQATRAWLIANNGDEVPLDIVEKITAAGGAVGPGAPRADGIQTSGLHLSDDAVDWIEAAANDEQPEALE